MKLSTILHTLIAVIAVISGIFLSPIPKKLGFYTWYAKIDPSHIGLTPAHHYGIPWGYTFEEYYSHCDEIKGQTALVTGSNSGIGFAIAHSLAKCGVDVTMACRNGQRCNSAAEEIRKDIEKLSTGAKIVTMIVDTSSLSSVQKFSKEFIAQSQGRPLDMLFLNAGRGIILGESDDTKSLILSEDGIEIFFATNYLGHHLMWKYLEPLVKNAPVGRVVLTSSGASFVTFPMKVATSLDELHGQKKPQISGEYYGQSKLAQIMWAKKVTRNLESDSNTFVNSAHPGFVDTPLLDKVNLWSMLKPLMNSLANAGWTKEEGALTLLYLGTEPQKLKDLNLRGKYFHPQSREVVNEFSLDEDLQDRLWDFSNELIADFVEN